MVDDSAINYSGNFHLIRWKLEIQPSYRVVEFNGVSIHLELKLLEILFSPSFERGIITLRRSIPNRRTGNIFAGDTYLWWGASLMRVKEIHNKNLQLHPHLEAIRLAKFSAWISCCIELHERFTICLLMCLLFFPSELLVPLDFK